MNKDICPLCGGEFHDDNVIFTAKLNTGILVIKDVPARVCNHCSYESLNYDTTIKIEEITKNIRSKNTNIEVEILKFHAA